MPPARIRKDSGPRYCVAFEKLTREKYLELRHTRTRLEANF